MSENNTTRDPEEIDSHKVVLVVEDDKNSLKMIEELLGKFGHTTVGLLNESLPKIQETLRQQKIDLVITDGLDGDWKAVCNLADAVGVKSLVVSSRGDYLGTADEQGRKTLHRGALEDMSSDTRHFPDWFARLFSEETK